MPLARKIVLHWFVRFLITVGALLTVFAVTGLIERRNPADIGLGLQRFAADWLKGAGVGAAYLCASAFRFNQLTAGAAITPANARFFAAPLPVVLHIVSVSVYALMGALQFAAGFRRRRPGWHRVAERVLVACGLLVGLSALWMTLFYPKPEGSGDLLVAFRPLFGSAMIVCVILGFVAIRKGNVMAHRAWMMRGFAIGLGAGTQAFTLLAGSLLIREPSGLSGALLMGAGWIINLAVAEWVIRKHPIHSFRVA